MRSLLAANWFLIVLAMSVAAALVFPSSVHRVMGHWEPRSTIAISLFLVAWTMPTRSLVAEVKHPWSAIWAVALSYGLVPLSAWAVGFLAPIEDIQIGLILVASVPCTLSSAILWTRLAGGNEATALLTVLGTTFSSWFLTTAWLYYLTGALVALDVPAMMFDLVVSLIVPVVVGQFLRRLPPCRAFAERHKVAIGLLSQLFVLAIVLKAGVTVGEKLHEPGMQGVTRIFLWSVLLAVSLHLWALGSGWMTSQWLGFSRPRQIAVAFAASQKTLQISLILLEPFAEKFPFAIMPMLFYHVGQLLIDTAIARRIARGNPILPTEDLPPAG